ncbi:hypothetical protein QYF36_020143 [Acer negundo]|nr:hypothetical protein QYF36_020143 [Acer negundo]
MVRRSLDRVSPPKMKKIQTVEKASEVTCFLSKANRIHKEVVDGQKGEFDKGKGSWVRKPKAKKLPSYYSNGKLSIGKEKDQDQKTFSSTLDSDTSGAFLANQVQASPNERSVGKNIVNSEETLNNKAM